MVTAIVDFFPSLHKGKRRPLFVLLLCFLMFLAGLPMTCSGGMYVFQLFDAYAASGFALLWVAFFEAVVIGWVYGSNKMYDNFNEMLDWRPSPYLKVCWMFVTPAFTLGVFIFSCVSFKPLEYNDYVYPAWGQAIGWIMAASSMVQVPIFCIYQMLSTKGTFRERWVLLTTPRHSQSYPSSYDAESIPVQDIGLSSATTRLPMEQENIDPPPYDETIVQTAEQGVNTI